MLELRRGTHVRVHKNLNLHNWTVRIKTVKGWRKLGGVDACHITNATPVASIPGRARIVRKGHREVVACVEGYWGDETAPDLVDSRAVHYNPFRRADFHYRDGETMTPFTRCAVASFPVLCPVFLAGSAVE
jgi:hypothetical protein